jgi:hypothetical protein
VNAVGCEAPSPHLKSLVIKFRQQGLQLALARQVFLLLAGHPREEQQVEELETQDAGEGRPPNDVAPGPERNPS